MPIYLTAHVFNVENHRSSIIEEARIFKVNQVKKIFNTVKHAIKRLGLKKAEKLGEKFYGEARVRTACRREAQ